MRRTDRHLSSDETLSLLSAGEWGTLATVGDDGCPYAVPLNYVLIDNALYFHCAKSGHKLDNIASEPRVSFNVTSNVQTLPDVVSTAFESVTVTGRAHMASPEEKQIALKALLEKFTFMSPDAVASYLDNRRDDPLHVYRIDIESMTGKRRPNPGTWSCTPGALHHIEIYVSNLETSRTFWSWFLQELGYTLFQEWEHGVSFKLRETYIVFVQTEKRHLEPEYHRCRTGLNHLAFHGRSTEHIEALTKDLLARGITLLYTDRHPNNGGPGPQKIFFEDPDRIKVEVCAPVS
jgi:nitroimidazol reductase NimA-like FMN-containing flavoprotein (pyridoxamine 5'-phosphate oxidase superfamily)/catechol 2,3-dioxygenase-like lactoylglutathione lyase family enzyme